MKVFYSEIILERIASNKILENLRKWSKYRLGAAYVGWGNYRIGIDSDRYVRHPIQNVVAHSIISPQPAFEVLSGGIKPYFQYQTRNKFTSW